MAFFVNYRAYKYDGHDFVELATEADVLALLNKHASNPDFEFEVVEGHRVNFEPVSVATQYQRK